MRRAIAATFVLLTSCTPDVLTTGSTGSGGAGASATSTATTGGPTQASSSSSAMGATTGATGGAASSSSGSSTDASTGTGALLCGNGMIDGGEACDDHNTEDYDGCDADCVVRGDTCANPIPLSVGLGPTLTINGTTINGKNTPSGTSCTNGFGNERWFAVQAQAAAFLTLWIDPANTDYDTRLYTLPACGAQASACANNDKDAPDVLSFPVAANATVLFAVDGATNGAFSLRVDLSTGEDCSDPVPLPIGDGASKNVTVTTDTTGKMDDNDAGTSAMGGCGGTLSPDVVYHVLPTGPGNPNLTVDGMGALQPVVYSRTTCTDHLLQPCNGTNMVGGNVDFVFNASYPAGAYLWVDGANGTAGPATLTLKP
ncbi:MAG: hypothetical protein U0414_10090 [Polyangiaceae bacterium]